jgi:hypothetical protein
VIEQEGENTDDPADTVSPMWAVVRRGSLSNSERTVAVVPGLPWTAAANGRRSGVGRSPVAALDQGEGGVSRRFFHCLNPECPVRHGMPLGRLTRDGGLVLDPSVQRIRVYLDTRRAVITCPSCGAERRFSGAAVLGGPA